MPSLKNGIGRKLANGQKGTVTSCYQFSAAGIERIAYEETEHYRITRNFLANPRRMLDILFDREAEPE